MATRSETIDSSGGRQPGSVLGRSAATGRYVLKPASKTGAISLRDAKTAVAHLSNGKKK